MNPRNFLYLAAFAAHAILGSSVHAQTPPAVATESGAEPVFATVNGKSITLREYQSAYATHVRGQFYHREGVAEERLQAARKEVADKLIERILLIDEANRRKLAPDEKKVDEVVAGYERRYANSPMWQQNRERMISGLRERIEEQSRLERLEQQVRNIPTPSEQDTRAFYTARPELFTEPAKLRLHTILLRVDPAAPDSVWQAARREAAELVEALRSGADFAETARRRSADRSAAQGGDMGYLHLGMVPEALQAKIDKLAVGVVGEPVDVLEGVGIFRLDERVPARHRDFESVKERATDLLLRDRQQSAWTDFVAALRRSADVRGGDVAGLGPR